MAPTTDKSTPTTHLDSRQQNTQDVPTCVKQCLDYFRSSAFPCVADDLSCQCSHYSSQGLTLGEIALGCSGLRCDPQSISRSDQKALYNICAKEEATVSAKHTSMITMPPYPTSSGLHTLSSSASSVSARATSSDITPSVSMDTSSAPSSTSTHVSATGMPLVPADDSFGQFTNLTSGQAVGISVAAMGGLCLTGALLYFLLWCKRRRAFKSPKPRNNSFDFIDKGAPRHSPFRHGHADPRGPLGGFAKPRVELEDGVSPQSQWYARRSQAPSPEAHPTMQSQSDRSISPESMTYDASRTVSQLLPEKAGQTPPQPPYKSPRAASVLARLPYSKRTERRQNCSAR
jgi:hypothetical protein